MLGFGPCLYRACRGKGLEGRNPLNHLERSGPCLYRACRGKASSRLFARRNPLHHLERIIPCLCCAIIGDKILGVYHLETYLCFIYNQPNYQYEN